MLKILVIGGVLGGLLVGGIEPHLQALPGPDDLLRDSRTLSMQEVARVVEFCRVAWNGKSFRVSGLANSEAPEFQIMMGANGIPRYARHLLDGMVVFEDHTGRAAVTCAGERLPARELVIDYSMAKPGAPWTTEARVSTLSSFPEFYEMLNGSLESGPTQKIRGRTARALVSSERLSSESPTRLPPGRKQYLWLDVETVLPLRWEFVKDGVPTEWGLSFAFDPSLVLTPPSGIVAPTCISRK